MIPDIAFMIVVAFTWVIAVFAIGGLGLLAFAVAGSSASLSDLTK